MKSNCKATERKILRAAGIVLVGVLLSRLFGLLKMQAITYRFGSSSLTDAFWVGFSLPNLLRLLLAEGVLSIAFIPVFSDYLSRGDREGAFRTANTTLTFLFLTLLVVVGLGILLAPYYLPLLAWGYLKDPSQKLLAVEMLRIMFPFLFFIGIAALVMGMLNSLSHFSTPAFAPVFFNVAVIFSVLFLTSHFGIYALAGGVVGGGILQLLVQIPSLKKRGFSFRPSFDLKDPGLRRILKLMGPAALGAVVLQLSVIITQNFASTLPGGSISYLRYSMILIQFPLGLFGVAISTAIFPTLSSLFSRQKIEKLKDSLSLGMRLVFLVLLPSTVGLLFIGKPLISLLFERGEFTSEHTRLTFQALWSYSLGLTSMGGVMVLNRGFYSLQDMVTPVKVSLFVLGVNFLLNLILIKPLKHQGLALSTSLSMTLNLVLLLVFLKQKLGEIRGKELILSLLKVGITTSGMGGGLLLLSSFSPFSGGGKVFFLLGGGALIFLALSRLFKLPELAIIKMALRNPRETLGGEE